MAAAQQDIAPQTMPEEYAGARFVVPQQVIFKSPDGMMIHGQLFLPPGAARDTRHPALLFFHGGALGLFAGFLHLAIFGV